MSPDYRWGQVDYRLTQEPIYEPQHSHEVTMEVKKM